MKSTKKISSRTRRDRHPRPKAKFAARTVGRMREVANLAALYFRVHGRSFPWRDESDPFKLAIAEILLQKTRASSAVGTYQLLISTFPNAEALSDASLDDLERILEPLGLSRKRAVQLKKMAKVVAELGIGIFDDWKVLLSDVPGLGAYAARAIACFGAGEPVGIVDANVARILRRVFRIESRDVRAVIYQRYADGIATLSEEPRSTNFGLLDIGATICITRPLCERCPFQGFCPRFGVSRRS